MGLSIILLAFFVSILFLSVRKRSERLERRVSERQKLVRQEVAQIDKSTKGEARFRATEAIYETHRYHPVQSVALGASFLVMLPVLLSALVLFIETDILVGRTLLFVGDLSQQDGMLMGVNLLPFLMTAVSAADAWFRFHDDRAIRNRFYLVSLVLLILVYTMPAGLVIYWTASNIASALTARLTGR